MSVRLVAATLIVAALTAAPAYGKGDMTATIVTPIPADAEPGTEVRMVWSLRIDVEQRSHPVNADGVYLRVVGADGSRQDAYSRPGAHEDGIYAATVRVPVGGVESAVVGIRGTATYARGRSVRRDAFFPLANEPVAPTASGRGWALPLPGLALAALSAVALGLAWRRRPHRGEPQGIGMGSVSRP
jgi:hypothetical protein